MKLYKYTELSNWFIGSLYKDLLPMEGKRLIFTASSSNEILIYSKNPSRSESSIGALWSHFGYTGNSDLYTVSFMLDSGILPPFAGGEKFLQLDIEEKLPKIEELEFFVVKAFVQSIVYINSLFIE